VAVVAVVVFGARENCCFKMSAYDLLVFVYVGLSSRQGRHEDGGSIPGGIDLRTIGSNFSSIQVRATSRLGLVVTIKHFVCVTDSMRKNHGCRTRCS